MTVTVIAQKQETKQIFIGKLTPQIDKWVEDINSSPLLSDDEKYEAKEVETQKSLYDLEKYLELDTYNLFRKGY